MKSPAPPALYNEILKRHHPDTATLRRELVAERHGLLRRERGVNWRVPAAGAS